ncbi:hypothetical protein NP493_447g00015 [Ridgeia piscesae]|uniref:Uncharacterized protein n=1 Tax=Ridgeia piscesae TaxID=27915 RepID=A0AAD9NS29_RIDPI|nr:hypothetical protein NP493_447g00015 [Ridgeia piscesae]
MYAQCTYLCVDGSSCQLSICIWFSATNTFRSTSFSKQIISNPTFRNTQQSTFINMLSPGLPSCSHFMTADKLVTASTNWLAPPPVDTVSASFVFVRSASRVLSFRGHSPLVYLPIRAFVFAAGIYIQILLHPLNDPI